MKALIVTAAAALLSTSAFAFDASWDADEFYSGTTVEQNLQGINLSSTENKNLYSEGNFVEVAPSTDSIVGMEIGAVGEPATHYMEGNYDV